MMETALQHPDTTQLRGEGGLIALVLLVGGPRAFGFLVGPESSRENQT